MNSNPPCSRCGGDQYKRGRSHIGAQCYCCLICGHWSSEYNSWLAVIDCTTPERCPYCNGRTHKHGIRAGRQYYHCNLCRRGSYGPIDPNRKTKPRLVTIACTTPGQCPYCAGRTIKDGSYSGKQKYECTACGRKCAGGRVAPKPPPPAPPSLETIAQRRLQAALLDAALLTIIRAALPRDLPSDIAEDITQEMAVDALDGAFDLSDLLALVPIYRRRINRLSSHTARFISIDSIVPGTNHLTYAETLIG
jgi:hypothetical protein